jgi:L,D-transpeptidase YcbB
MSSNGTVCQAGAPRNEKYSSASHKKVGAEEGNVRDFWLFGFTLLPILVLASCLDHKANSVRAGDSPAEITPGPHQLTTQGQAELSAIVDAAELPELRWPKFKKYRLEVKELYDSMHGVLPWARASKPTRQARAIIQLLQTADTEGLTADDYDALRWDARLNNLDQSSFPSESAMIHFDVALTVSVMRYVSDLHLGRVNPRLFHFELDVGDKTFDLSEFLRRELVNSPDVSSAIKALELPFPTYSRTLAALKTYTELARRDDGELLPVPAKPAKPGDRYPGLPRLIRLLGLLGDLPEKERGQTSQAVYEGALVDAVKHFQQRHGLDPTGLIDAPTVSELNTPLGQRVTQLQLTLERWRWLPHQFQRPPVVVNIPEFRLRAVDEQYRWVLFMRVVVGRAYRHRTPVFASSIQSLIFRPVWNVPLSIVRAELLPHVEEDPAYLGKHAYEIVDRAGNVFGEVAVNDTERQLYSGRLRIRQKPGPNNALGLMKFDLPNTHDVYMHGTPATELFSKSRRDFSHGCIRVEDPVALAAWLLRDKPEWTADRIHAAMLGEKTFRVNLEKVVPVLIVYGTAVPMQDGEVRFFHDIYGHDAALERTLSDRYLHFDEP